MRRSISFITFAPAGAASVSSSDLTTGAGSAAETIPVGDPVIGVAVPGGAIGGTYSGTIVHSVS